jgi:hypothetical protein
LCSGFRETAKGKKAKRLPGAGRKVTQKERDTELANWVREQRQLKVKVSRSMIKCRAEKMFKPENPEFKVGLSRLPRKNSSVLMLGK